MLRLFSGHYAKSARILSSPPARPGSRSPIDAAPSLESGPSCLQHLSSTNRVWQQRRNSLRERESWTHPGLGLGCLPAPLMFVCWQVFAEYEINLSLSLASRELSTEFSKFSTARIWISNSKTFHRVTKNNHRNEAKPSIIKSKRTKSIMYWRNQRFNLKQNVLIKTQNAVLNYDPTKLLTGEIVSCKINNSCFLSANLKFFPRLNTSGVLHWAHTIYYWFDTKPGAKRPRLA